VCENIGNQQPKQCAKYVIQTSVEHAANAFGYKCKRVLLDDETTLSPPILSTQNTEHMTKYDN